MITYTGMAFLYTLSSVPESDLLRLAKVFQYSDALASGISAERLYSYRDSGLIEQIGRGLFRRTDGEPADLDLLEIAHRSRRATLCLISALARHDLTDI